MKKTAITGATGIIGQEIIRFLVGKQKSVLAIVRNKSKAEKVFSDIDPNLIHYQETDLLKMESVEELILAHRSQIEHFIHCARETSNLKSDGQITQEQFLKEYSLNNYVPYYITYQLANVQNPEIKSVVLLSSIYGVVAGNSNIYQNIDVELPIHYGVSKAAVVHLTKELAVRCAKKNIRVNCVSYGGVEGRAPAEFVKKYASYCPQNRMLSKRDIGGIMHFLTSSEADAITGQNIIVDGGWTSW